MTSKQTKRIAFLLAASLLMNTVALPVSAESDVAIVEEAPTEAPTEAPVEIVTEPPTEAPTAEAATEAPTEAVTEAPTEEAATVPTETPTEEVPTEEATETPTGEAPTEEATEAPTEEPTEPLTREDILAAQQEGYQQALSHFRSMDISDDRTMSLEWWCVMTGNVSMREPDYSILDAQEEIGAPQEETTEKTWADYIVFSEVISVRSASDLILLSYVSPSLYQNRTVTLFADAGNEFDLVHPLSVTAERTLNYRGMGDLGSPFSGTIRYAENSENITFVLDAPLFIGLSTKAKFLNSLNQPNTIFLVSKAGFAFDGLLARHILGEQQDEANWFIQLNAPDFTGGAVYVLPSLLGILYGNANVSLLLTDNSCLSPSPRGYLCATMYAQSSLSAWNITRSVSVPLVGEKADDAVLTTDAILPTEPTEEVTEPTGEATEPTGEATEPTEEVTEPTEEVTEPTEEATEPTGEATEPTEEVTEPTEEVTEPTEEVTEPTGEATEPTEEVTEPTEEVTEPTEVTEPNQDATEPTEEVTEPTEEVTEPTEVTEPNQDATEPTEDAIAPTQPGKIPMYYEEMSDEEFNALVAYYCAMPVVPGKMPLEWWFAVCGKLEELRAYLALKSQEPAPLPDEFDVKEVDSSTDSTLPTIITYPEPTETETPAPTGASAQNEPEDVQAADAPEALLLDAPEAAAMADEPAAMAAEDAPAAMAEAENVPTAGAETEPPAAEMTLPDDSPAPAEATEATVATEATEAVEDNAAAEPAEDGAAAEPGDTTGADEGIAPQEEIKLDISSTDDLIKLSCVDAAEYQHETITVTASSGSINLCDKLSGGTTTFQGLGSDAAPFAGTFRYSGGSEKTSITLNRGFFNALSASAAIDHINLTWAGIVDESVDAAILALTVTKGTGTWTVNLDKHTGDTGTTETYRLPALIHTIAAGAAVTLTATNASTYPFAGQGFYCDKLNGTLTVNNPILPTFSTTKNNVGGLVGSMTGKATLNVNGNITIDVVTSGSTAGGFVGMMEAGATLKISGSTITVQQVSASRVDGSCVGTLVGVATNPNFTFENASITAGNASATTGYHLNGRLVGGLVGKLTYSKEGSLSVLPIVGLKLLGHNCGGLFGELYNGAAFSLSYTSETLLADVTFSGENGSGGGLVGYYRSTAAGASFSAANVRTNLSVNNQRFTMVGGFIANADKAGGSGDTSFTFVNAKASLTSGSTADCLGGFIGTVGGGGNTYVTLTGCTVENCAPSANISNLGGMVGKLGNSVTHLKVTGSTVTCDFSSDNHGSTGGIVGLAEDYGHLIEVDTFTLTAANIRGGNCGGLVGKMDSGVLYLHNVPDLTINDLAPGASHGWIVGNRGNALVCSKDVLTPIAVSNPEKQLNDTGIWGQVLQLSQFDENLVTLDSQTHNVSIRALPAKDGNYYTIGSLTDFASVALRLQLDPKGMLTIDNDISGGTVKLTLNADINLTGTGLTGLTRDNSVGESYGFDIQGNGNTITLPNVKIFAGPGSHIFQGLIGQCRSGLTLENLTVAGGSEIFCPNYQNTSVHCGIVGEMRSSATITSTNSSVSWTLGGWAKDSNLSGFIAVTSVNNELNFTDSTWTGSLVDISGTDGGVCRLGGFIANGFYNEGQKPSITVTSCTISGTVRNTVSKDYEAAMGGLFGSLRYCQKLDINGLTVSTDFQSSSKKASGGLLGYELNCNNATFNGVVIEKASLETDTKFGGLIYKGAGHWKVQGIHFKSATISGQTDDKTPSGLLVSIGCSHTEVGGYEGLYLEVAHGAYNIEPGVTVSITGGKYFDELVGRSIYDASSGRNGIVSIATENAALIDKDGCNTYKNQLQDWENPCTRYYYNLDAYLTSVTDNDGIINTPQEMVLWSAYNECRNCTKGGAIGGASASICGFFQKGNRNLITGDINLSGYSFYPVVFEGTSIQDANITFSFQQLDEKENEANNKQPSNSQRQHAGMHTGIFKEITSKNATLSVQNLTLQGTVGSLGSSSGALVRDNVVGAVKQSETDQEFTLLNIQNVTLNGIRVLPAPTGDRVSPLLIGSIGSHVKLQLTDVTASGYGENTTAASSLIGNVGDAKATNIDLKFSGINLSPADNKADCKLFSRALFLESFQYSTGCRGVYNFTSKENYTIGKEVSNTDTGRNPGKQHWFFYEWDTPSGLVAGENGVDAAAFTRYVAQAETGSYHELDVNLQPLDLIEGCGTYSDPYRITDGKVLYEVFKALKQGGKNETWKVRINTAVLPSTGAAPDFSRDDGHTHDGATGEQELVLECGADGTWRISDSEDPKTITSALMRDYLRNAYYMITSDIELPSEWTGLGTVSAPFRGVIVGQKDDGTIPTVTVTTTGAQQFGGLVLFSQGSVIKNLDIAFRSQDKFTISGSGSIKDYSSAVFFGGVVGCCNAGDTVIDSVTVTLPKAFSFPGYYVVVGGYVGLVGGANNQGGGGVVFRSISNPGDPTAGSQFTYPYSGPFVGRVLDGYAVSETPIDKWNENYQVPTLDNPSLTFNDNTVTVGNGHGLWLLSAMENSRHGGAYTRGKPRTCAYGTVGQPIPDDVKGDETGSGQTSFYLWKHYGKTELPTSFQLVFTGDCNMTDFGNGFRGIGVSQGTFRAYLNDYPVITGINGKDRTFTVTLAQTREEPKGEQADWAAMGVGLFPVLNAGQSLVVQNLHLTGTANLSVGDRATNATPVFHDGYQRTMVGAGMLAGALVNRQAGASITIQNVSASGSVVTNALMAGGLIGYCGSPVTKINGAAAFGKPASITVNGCKVSGITVKASSIFGGFIGFGYANTITIEDCAATSITPEDPSITLAATGPKNDGVYLNGATTNNIANGVGGIIGTAYQNQLTIRGITLSGLSLDIPNRQNANSFGFGSIVGSLDAFGSSSLTNINMQGVNELYADNKDNNPPVGGLIGYLRNHTNPQVQLTISGVNIATETGSKLSQRGYYDGGLVGLTSGNNLLLVGGATENEAVRIGNTSGNVTISKGGANGFNSGVVSSTRGSLTMTIQNLHMTGVTVNGAALTSLVFAGVESGYITATITLKNSEFISCKLDKNLEHASGYLFGSPWNGTIGFNGFNILLKDCSTAAPGIFAGEVNKNGSYMHLTAVSLVNCSGGARDFYSGSDAYAIRANYTGDQGYQNSSSNPWMDCNPLSDLNGLVDGITTPIAGNGAAFMADGKTPVASKIVEDSKTGSTIEASKRHYNASAAADFFAANDYGISISTFGTAGGNASTAGMPDFPVLVVPPLGRITASKSIYGYISLLTNTPSDATTLTSKLKGSITAQTYQWNEGKFTAITDSSITVEQDGTIHVMPGKFDNTLNQFTLLTVSYQDPTYAGNSYKLYIPIVVQKLLNYHFYASAISGTLYNRKPYETMNSLVVTTHGDQVTVLLSYVYDNGKTGSPAIAEWQNSIDNGDNLLWNFDKKIVVARDGNNDLPTGTKLTLVDRNNRDRAYYATYDGSGIIPLNSFKDAAEQPYEKNALCDAMGLKAEAADDGLFVQETDMAKATVRILENGKYVYYRLAAEGDTAQKYSITVGNDTLLEEYYLTIQTPANSEELSNIKIQCEASLKNETGDTMLPNKFIEADSQHPYTRNNAENRILFGNFFEQTVTVTTNTPEEISDANNTINATLTVAINYKSDAWKERFAPYAKSIQLYQRFELQAMDWTDGTSASTSFTDRTATVRYLNGTTPVGSAKATKLGAEGIMVLKFPESVTVSTNTELDAATLIAEVSLAYTSDQIQAQFHTRSNNTDGLQLWANSHLAFSDAALERSNNPTSGSDSKYFYRTESTPATLVYNANGTDVDARVNQLGVNGRVQDAASIDSVATYNVSVLDAAKNADTILYSIELYAKDADGKFTQKIEDYSELLKVGNITATLADRNGTEKPVNFGEAFTGGIDPSIPIRISLPLTVVTGNGFTGPYANYKVNLRVWLQNGNAQITGSEATDYIIYTNAKIKFPLVTIN